MGVIEDEVEKRKKELDVLLQQIKACGKQSVDTLNAADQPRLEAQLENLKAEYQKKLSEIKWWETGDIPAMTPRLCGKLKADVHKDWTENLMWLDYMEPTNHFANLIKEDAVLMLLQRGEEMKVDLYLKRIRKAVEGSCHLRVYPERFTEFGIMDRQGFTQHWRSKLHLPEWDGANEVSTREVIAKLAGSVDYGQTLWLEIYMNEVTDDFYPWFLQEFWNVLVRDPRLNEKGIAVVTILILEDAIPNPSLLEPCCKPSNFNTKQYCEVELTNWSQQDIEKWISKHMNQSLHKRRLSTQNAKSLSKRVYKCSHQGIPLNAYDFILGTLLNEIFQPLEDAAHAAS